MYRKMYETQAEWGEQQIPADDVFRGFAEQLGLDMSAFETLSRSNAFGSEWRTPDPAAAEPS